jgi:hypothetical protein
MKQRASRPHIIPLPVPAPIASPPEQATEEGSLRELLDSAAPPPPIIDKQLEAAARGIKATSKARGTRPLPC